MATIDDVLKKYQDVESVDNTEYTPDEEDEMIESALNETEHQLDTNPPETIMSDIPQGPSPKVEKSIVDKIVEAQAQRRAALNRAQILSGASKLAAGVAGHGARPVDIGGMEAEKAKLPVTEVKEEYAAQDEATLRDPSSEASKLARAVATKAGLQVPKGMSAFDLQKLGIKLPASLRGRRDRWGLTTVADKSGKPIQVRVNLDTGETAPIFDDVNTMNLTSQRAYAPSFLKVPRTGEYALASKTAGIAPIPVTGPARSEVPEKGEKLDLQYSQLPKEYQKHVDKIEDEYRKDIQDSREFSEIIVSIEDLVESDISAAIPAIKRQLARSVGKEVGVMTDRDVEAFSGDQSLIGALNRFAKKQATGKLTDEDKRQYMGIIKIAKRNLTKAMENRANYHTNRLSQRIPTASQRSLKNMLSVQSSQPVGLDKVKMKAPDGSVRIVPKDKVEYFKSKGAEVVE